MGGQQVTGKHTGDLFLLVETDVEQEAWADPQSDVSQLLPKRIAFRDAKRSARVANVFRAVIAHHRFQSGATGHDPFRAAAKPGKEVRLDETCEIGRASCRERVQMSV